MEARAKLLGHPIHPMLIPFPLGLLTTAAIFDVIYLVTTKPGLAAAAFFAIAAGIVGGLLAAVFGLVDWLAVPAGTRAKRIGVLHGVGNVVVVAVFAASWLLRLGAPDYRPSALAVGLSIGGALLGGVTGWLGGELVDRLGIGVDDGAHPDSPNSLSGQPAHGG
jgi:uncharacterized membrane protein